MLVTYIFLFFHNVFKGLLSEGSVKSGLCGKGVTDMVNSLPNDKILDQSNLKYCAEYKINVTYVTNFLHFPRSLLPFQTQKS